MPNTKSIKRVKMEYYRTISPKSKIRQMTFHIRGFSRNCNEAMIYGAIAPMPMPMVMAMAKMTGTFRIRYINISERNRSYVFSFKL